MGHVFKIAVGYCETDDWLGSFLVVLFQFANDFWPFLAGMSFIHPELYLAALAIWSHYDEVLFWYFLARYFNELSPPCPEIIDEARQGGMPSYLTQMSFSIGTYLFVNMLLVQRVYALRILAFVVAMPFLVGTGLYITDNNSFMQVVVGALIGILNGARKVITYHFFFKHYWTVLSRVPIVRWFFPAGSVMLLEEKHLEEEIDLDTKMILQTVSNGSMTEYKRQHELSGKPKHSFDHNFMAGDADKADSDEMYGYLYYDFWRKFMRGLVGLEKETEKTSPVYAPAKREGFYSRLRNKLVFRRAENATYPMLGALVASLASFLLPAASGLPLLADAYIEVYLGASTAIIVFALLLVYTVRKLTMWLLLLLVLQIIADFGIYALFIRLPGEVNTDIPRFWDDYFRALLIIIVHTIAATCLLISMFGLEYLTLNERFSIPNNYRVRPLQETWRFAVLVTLAVVYGLAVIALIFLTLHAPLNEIAAHLWLTLPACSITILFLSILKRGLSVYAAAGYGLGLFVFHLYAAVIHFPGQRDTFDAHFGEAVYYWSSIVLHVACAAITLAFCGVTTLYDTLTGKL